MMMQKHIMYLGTHACIMHDNAWNAAFLKFSIIFFLSSFLSILILFLAFVFTFTSSSGLCKRVYKFTFAYHSSLNYARVTSVSIKFGSGQKKKRRLSRQE